MSQGRPADPSELVRLHYDDVYRFCARRIGPEHAKDACQETFLTACHALARFRGDSDIRIWLFGIAHNQCRALARQKRLKDVSLDFEEASPDAEGQLVDREALRQAFGKLSPEHRHVVMLKEMEGLSYDDCAKVLGVPSGTVKSRLHHAFLLLRRTLSDNGGAQ